MDLNVLPAVGNQSLNLWHSLNIISTPFVISGQEDRVYPRPQTGSLNRCTTVIITLQTTPVPLSPPTPSPPFDPPALQPLLPNTVSFLVSFSLQPSCWDLNLLPRLNWGDSSLNHCLLVVLPPFFIHFNHQTPVTGNIGPSVWNLPHKREGRGH